MHSRVTGILATFVLAAGLLAGCATAAPGSAASGVSASPTPTAACPEQPGVELPPECAGYDPDQAMAQNEMYRQRMELSAEAQAEGERLQQPATEALESLRVGEETVTEDAVRIALQTVGFAEVQTRSGAGDVLFGATLPSGGCLFGAVEVERVTAEVGGYILDGGCLPAQ